MFSKYSRNKSIFFWQCLFAMSFRNLFMKIRCFESLYDQIAKRKFYSFLGCIFFFSSWLYSYPTFEQAMTNSEYYVPRRADRSQNWTLYKSIYESYRNNYELNEDSIIPKIIHFIWLGSPLPERCKRMIDTWISFHPEWEVKLWTDDEVASFNLENYSVFCSSINFGEKADIFRYEILYRYGGLYVDTDFECLASFDNLHRSCEFYAGIAYDSEPSLYNGLIGAKAGHPILKACVENIQLSASDNDAVRIMNEAGPNYFSKLFLSFAQKNDTSKIVPFPVNFFYPFPGNIRNELTDITQRKTFLKNESMALHHWAVSWCK